MALSVIVNRVVKMLDRVGTCLLQTLTTIVSLNGFFLDNYLTRYNLGLIDWLTNEIPFIPPLLPIPLPPPRRSALQITNRLWFQKKVVFIFNWCSKWLVDLGVLEFEHKLLLVDVFDSIL